MEGDDFGLIRAVTGNGVVARQLERRFVRFGAGVHEHHALGEGGIHQLAAQTQRRLVGKDIAGMPQGFSLLMQRRDQSRMTMP